LFLNQKEKSNLTEGDKQFKEIAPMRFLSHWS